MKKISALIILLFFSFLSYGQEKDSVLLALDTIKTDTAKVTYLFQQGSQILKKNPDKALIYFEKAEKYSKANNNYNLCYIKQMYFAYYKIKSDYHTAYKYAEDALKCFEQANDEHSRAAMYVNIAILEYMFGNYDKAIGYFKKAKNIYEALGDTNRIASSYNNLGIVYYELGDYDKSLKFYNKSLEMAKALGNDFLRAKLLNNIALIYKVKGEYDEALKTNFEALELEKKLGNKENIANAYNNIGVIYKLSGDYKSAITYYKKARKLYEELGNKEGIADQYNNIGLLYYDKGKLNEAVENFIKSAEMYGKIGRTKSFLNAKTNLARCYILQQEYDKAKSSLMTAIKIGLRTGQKKELSMAYMELGKLYARLKDYEKAITYYIKSLNIKKSLDFKDGIANTYRVIGELYLDKREPLKALSFLVKAKQIFETLGNKKGLADTYENIAQAYFDAYDKTGNNKFFARAEENALKSFQISKEEEFLNNQMEIAKILKKINTIKGNYPEALKYADIYEQLRDTVYAADKQKAMMELQAKYEASEKEQKIKLQNEQLARMKAENERKQIQLYHEKSLRIFLISGGIILFVFLLLTFKAYKDKSKLNTLLASQKEVIEQKNGELNQLVEEVSAQRDEMQKQKELMESIHNELKKSITYAEGLQLSLLPPIGNLKNYFDDFFMLYMPRDIVSGDFYWWTKVENKIIFSVADCTGHGVPGAFMSILGMTLLREVVEIRRTLNPAAILESMKSEIITALNKNRDYMQKDGIDMSVIVYDMDGGTLEFAGAYNGIYLIHNKMPEIISGDKNRVVKFNKEVRGLQLYELKADKIPVGIHFREDKFSSVKFKAEKGMTLYLYTDGYADQFGGLKGKKFKSTKLKSLLLETAGMSMSDQERILSHTFISWKKEYFQVDDVTIGGLRI